MVDEKALAVSLEEFGLGRYESQAYVSLLSRGTMSASELAYYSGLPRTKIYPTLLKLKDKKLAIISRKKTITYTAIAPEDAFDGVIRDQVGRVNAMNALVSGLKRISDAGRKSRGTEEKRYFHLAASSIQDQLGAMIEGAKYSIHITVDQWGLGLLAGCKEQLLATLRRNLEVGVIIPASQLGSESFRMLPGGIKIRASETVRNCFIFDGADLLVVDGSSGNGEIFPSAGILGSNESGVFAHAWKHAVKTYGLSDMNKSEAQEIYRMIRIIDENALGHMLDSEMISKNRFDLLRILDKNGISLVDRSVGEVIEMVDSALQITCSGHAILDAKAKNISVESRINNGHSLPWVALLDGYLKKSGYKTKMTYQNQVQKGERVHLKFGAKN